VCSERNFKRTEIEFNASDVLLNEAVTRYGKNYMEVRIIECLLAVLKVDPPLVATGLI